MQRGALPDLNTFLLVAEHLSFRAAAERLELTAPAVSHSIRQLEARLGVRLLNRTTRSVSLTHAGLRLVDRLRPAFDQISGALEELNEERRRPTGRLRIRVSNVAAPIVVMPMWQRFLSTYPEVQLEIWADMEQMDIVASGFDAGIGPKRLGGVRHDRGAPHRADQDRRRRLAGVFRRSAATALARRPRLAQLHSISILRTGTALQMAFSAEWRMLPN